MVVDICIVDMLLIMGKLRLISPVKRFLIVSRGQSPHILKKAGESDAFQNAPTEMPSLTGQIYAVELIMNNTGECEE